MLYSEQDERTNRARLKREGIKCALFAVPFLVMAVIGFIVRMELLCIVGCVLFCAVLIFMIDLRVIPLARYGRFLREIESGLSRQTGGTLMRVGKESVYEDGVNFHEMIINIYEDMSPDGERRFLLDCTKSCPLEWVGQDVVVTSHGNMVLGIRMAKKEGQA